MRVLIIKLSSIGDVAHTLPAAAALRRALPDARIAWAVERRAAAILKDSPVIDDLMELDLRARRKRLLSRATLADLRARLGQVKGVDVAIDFQGLMKSGLVAYASGAARRIGFETAELRERASRVFLTEQVTTSDRRHVIEKNLALVRAVTGEDCSAQGGYEFPIAVSSEDEQYIADATGQYGPRFAILNPGGGWATKLWPAERFGQIADWLWEERGLVSFITYGPGEEALAQAVAAGAFSGKALPLATTLKQFVALARRAALFVGGDTGPLHLAAAAGTPIVGIYGPTAPERNGPFDRRDITVGRDLWCRPQCHRRSCWHWECMDISVEQVRQAIALRLENAEVWTGQTR
ncbi:MAG TPA: glycosyltransferase family 9 protein [Blastocatellia bacterium]|nr:glycosyltransferase family 9 protein [Blastocatellia bacterium]